MSSYDAVKRLLRLQVTAARRAAHAVLRDQAGSTIAAHALAAAPLAVATVVAGYWPMGEEADPIPLLESLAGDHILALPVVVGRGLALQFRRWIPGDLLEPGGHGTRHPPDHAELVRPDLLLVPLLAFDAQGGRLGYGGGYYDRTLEALRAAGPVVAMGVAYAAQEVEEVPRDGHDQGLDWVVTERGARKF